MDRIGFGRGESPRLAWEKELTACPATDCGLRAGAAQLLREAGALTSPKPLFF